MRAGSWRGTGLNPNIAAISSQASKCKDLIRFALAQKLGSRRAAWHAGEPRAISIFEHVLCPGRSGKLVRAACPERPSARASADSFTIRIDAAGGLR
ncbi:hypothetical protein GCM10027046_36570 [Uliginosibacterium flavum]